VALGAGRRGPLSARRAGTTLTGLWLAALAACGGEGERRYREVAVELLRRPDLIEIQRPSRRGQVTVSPVTPVDAAQTGEGTRPALVVPPGARVSIELPDLGRRAELNLALGVDRETHKAFEEGGNRVRARMLVTLDDELVVEETIVVGGPPEERGWRPHRIPVPDGGRLELTVEAPGSRVIESAFAGLELELERRAPRTRSSPDRPNLVLVVIDTLRADRLSSQGYSRPTSPALDALAEDGVRWSDAWSVAPWTWPSTASILTGAQPPEHGVLNEFSCYLPETREVLAERLRAEGFATAAVSTNPLISPGQNFDQGFDTYELLPWARSTEALPRAIERLESFGDERFLLYLHLTDPHLPFEPEPELRERFVEAPRPEGFEFADLERRYDERAVGDPWRAELRRHLSELYDAEVAAADRGVATLLGALDRLDQRRRTLVVVTSDHGEELFEHGRLGHSHQLFREALQVPLIAAGPGLPRGRVVDSPVQNHRLLPSLLEWLGLESDRRLPQPLPLATASEPLAPLWFSTEVGAWIGERDNARLLARRAGGEFGLFAPGREAVALFDTRADPGELHDVAGRRPERAAAVAEELGRWWDAHEVERPGALGGDAATTEMLRRLGYLDAR
jgi:arylsulfatase A-like enzyme